MSEPRFFRSPGEWNAWLKKNHASATEVIVGIYKNGASKRGLTRQEMVDGALAYGWIDGHLRSLGAEAYQIRVSPRRKGSIWSTINIRRVGELTEAGAMAEPGLAVFKSRDPKKAYLYSFEVARARFTSTQLKALSAVPKAHAFFRAQPPGYRHAATYWVNGAKLEVTKIRRMETLIADSAAGRRLKQLVSPVAAYKRKARS